MCRLSGLLLAIGMTLGAAAAEAHPHVWIAARSEVVYAPDGSITGVRHAWTFDEMFTTYALQGLASVFVTRVEGSLTNVVGLPLEALIETLPSLGWPSRNQTGESMSVRG